MLRMPVFQKEPVTGKNHPTVFLASIYGQFFILVCELKIFFILVCELKFFFILDFELKFFFILVCELKFHDKS